MLFSTFKSMFLNGSTATLTCENNEQEHRNRQREKTKYVILLNENELVKITNLIRARMSSNRSSDLTQSDNVSPLVILVKQFPLNQVQTQNLETPRDVE